ncbi:MAG: hypothetical protein ACLQJ7_15510 [Syntrophobacteraceae bacterium]
MKRWIIFVLFAILLSYPAVSGAGDDTFAPGHGTSFGLPFMSLPIDSPPDSGDQKVKNADKEAKYDEQKQKEIRDKKIDDAIKQAWEQK